MVRIARLNVQRRRHRYDRDNAVPVVTGARRKTLAKREIYKFLSGFLAGAGVVHANIGFGIATGMFNEPHYLGRTWSAAPLWVGAAVYLVASLLLGYLGWRSSKAPLLPADRPKSHT
jgi:hypothetical protein